MTVFFFLFFFLSRSSSMQESAVNVSPLSAAVDIKGETLTSKGACPLVNYRKQTFILLETQECKVPSNGKFNLFLAALKKQLEGKLCTKKGGQ